MLCKYTKIITLILIILNKCLSIDIYIPNEIYTIYNLTSIIEKYSLISKTINVYITENVIESSLNYQQGFQIDIPGNIDFALYGKEEKGTEIKLGKNGFYFSINFKEYTGQKIKFENIKFYDFQDPQQLNSIFYSRVTSSDFSITFKKCTFEKGNGRFLIFEAENSSLIKSNDNKINITLDSCKFIDIKGSGVLHFSTKNEQTLNHQLSFLISNSEFNNCDDISKISFGKIEYNNFPFMKASGNLIK
ncbi:hypothetical protein BCR36DRAFT_280400 [Piromyces finnis]|uniref:Right handed beta helix domain-containing protein n=1 Tax=Piromyces finnis TaxID=1754191 RepID=A0A1Y1VI37_9FUNG|nr:hypothetical protein BCR36DRAFT_280400 [Piromyces finnis]|eukprot:ORX56693.1 hypothetical protein BCR36DRAFT_280400 [Piromyces finnis]